MMNSILKLVICSLVIFGIVVGLYQISIWTFVYAIISTLYISTTHTYRGIRYKRKYQLLHGRLYKVNVYFLHILGLVSFCFHHYGVWDLFVSYLPIVKGL